MTIKEWADNYDNAMNFFLREKKDKGRSACTMRNLESALTRFRDFYVKAHAGESDVKDPGYLDIQAWRENLESIGTANSSIKTYLVVLHGFFDSMSDEALGDIRFFTRNPVSYRLFPDDKESKKPYDIILTDEQVVKLWKNEPVTGKGLKPQKWPRNYAIVIMLLTTELRNAELLDLKLSDLDFEYDEIQVWRGKGNKYRCIDFPEIAQTAVKLYLKSGMRPAGLSDDDYLFGTDSEKGVRASRRGLDWHKGSDRWLRELVCRHVKMVTGVDNVRTHDLRHVGARLDLHNGMRMEELQAKLGHSQITTTQIYSGKLGANRKRTSAKAVYEIRDKQTLVNRAMLMA